MLSRPLKSNMALERIRLLVHILRMVAGPLDKQCAAVQKLDLNVKKLEEVTMKSMSSWFNDAEHTENSSKESLLKGIFKVAKAEERYKKGEIGKVARLYDWAIGLTRSFR